MNVSAEQKQTHRLGKQTYDYQRGQVWGAEWAGGLGLAHTHTAVDGITDQRGQDSTGNFIQYSVMIYMGKESEKE